MFAQYIHNVVKISKNTTSPNGKLVLLTVIIFYSVLEYYSADCNKRISITVGFQKQAQKQSLESANQNLNKGIACSAN